MYMVKFRNYGTHDHNIATIVISHERLTAFLANPMFDVIAWEKV